MSVSNQEQTKDKDWVKVEVLDISIFRSKDFGVGVNYIQKDDAVVFKPV